MSKFISLLLVELLAFGLLANPQVGTPSYHAVITKKPGASVILFTKRINNGGPSYTDVNSKVWEAANGCGPHQSYTDPALTPISGTLDDALYQDEDWGDTLDPATGLPVLDCSYTVPNGFYTVTLKFAEIYYGSGPGGADITRMFDIYINNILVYDNYSTQSNFSSFYATDLSFPNVDATNGVISIHLISSASDTDNPHIMATQLDQTTDSGTTSGTLLTTFMPGGVCPTTSTNVASQVQTAFNSIGTGQRLIMNCNVGISSQVLWNGKTNATLDATAGGGFTFLGTPPNNYEMFKVSNCTDCTVKNLTVDMNFRNALGFMSDTNTRLIFQNNTIKNNGAFSGGAAWWRSGNGNKILNNTLVNIQPIMANATTVQDVNCRGFWVGEGGGYERDAEIARNITHSSGHTYIVYSGVNGWIHHNYGDGLTYEGVKVSSGGDYPNPGTTIIEDNEFHGSTAGWTTVGGSPVNGGHLQLGMAGNGLENFIIRYNTWDGGSQGMGFVGQVGNVDLHHNRIINQWDTGVLIQNNSHGTINIHHNRFESTRPSARGFNTPVIIRMMSDVGQNFTIQNVIMDSNWISLASFTGVHYLGRSGTITGTTITRNAFVSNSAQAIYIEQTSGTINTPTIGSGGTANCYSGNNNGGDSIFDSRGVITTQPTQVGSCSDPAGTVGPRP